MGADLRAVPAMFAKPDGLEVLACDEVSSPGLPIKVQECVSVWNWLPWVNWLDADSREGCQTHLVCAAMGKCLSLSSSYYANNCPSALHFPSRNDQRDLCVRYDAPSLLEPSCFQCIYCFGRLREIRVPDSVRELCDKCFFECECLYRVTFGVSSSLERIGTAALRGTAVVLVPQL